MFGVKKVELALRKAKQDQKQKAQDLINESFKELETKGDYSYTIGLIEMAYTLELITLNERALAKDEANKKLNKILSRVD